MKQFQQNILKQEYLFIYYYIFLMEKFIFHADWPI